MQARPPATQSNAQPLYVLYIRQGCPRSQALTEALSRDPIPGLLIQDVNKIDPIPGWLDGTPTFADVATGNIYKGSDAMLCVQRLIEHKKSLQPPKPPAPHNPMDELFRLDEPVATDKYMGNAGQRGGWSEQTISDLRSRYSQPSHA